MRFVVVMFCALGVWTTAAQAGTPPEIMTPYQAYRSQLAAQDYTAALGSAKKAWQQSEKIFGDSKMTGDLAQNYGLLAIQLEQDALPAFLRATELARFHDLEKSPEIYLDRELTVIRLLYDASRYVEELTHIVAAESFLTDHDLWQSVYAGEVMIEKSKHALAQENFDDTLLYAKKALEIFSTKDQAEVGEYPVLANMLAALAAEQKRDYLGAALYSQPVMEAFGKTEAGRNGEMYMTSFRRWLRARYQLLHNGKLQMAEEAGLCRCWPYDTPRNETIKQVTKRIVLDGIHEIPAGLVIYEFDLNDSGRPVNIRTLMVHPANMTLTKFTKRLLKKTKYAARKEGETAESRKNLVEFLDFLGLSVTVEWEARAANR